jgi:aldehyde dehydrogenase (NAD+)
MMQLIKDQREFFETNRTKPIAFRIEQLTRLKEIIMNNYARVEEAVYKDYGKSKFETHLGELSIVIEELTLAISNLAEWASIKPKKNHVINMPGKSYVVPEPLGVSLIIGPWNYPFQLILAPAVGALAAGCTVVLKPSELTPYTSRLLADLIGFNFNPNYFSVVEGGVEETTALLKEKFDIIFFTGSLPVGRIVYEAAAKNLTPVVLELGGKSPAILWKTAN